MEGRLHRFQRQIAEGANRHKLTDELCNPALALAFYPQTEATEYPGDHANTRDLQVSILRACPYWPRSVVGLISEGQRYPPLTEQ